MSLAPDCDHQQGSRSVADIVSPARRSEMMGRIRGKGTRPELVVRSTAHRLGYRFRLHDRKLPGSPDLVFPGRKLALFVHGCFWHRHEGCRSCYVPKSNIQFWREKFKNNVARDKRVRTRLEGMGWRVAILWECETADSDSLRTRLKELLDL
jgi:DNA mismatch endonuclease, patch repair protein